MKSWKICALATCAALLMSGPALAAGDEDLALTELLQILKKQGVIEEDQYQALSMKAAKQEKKRSWTDRVSIWGDFRGRYEHFSYFDQNPVNGNAYLPDRDRFRLRLRLNMKGEVTDYASVHVRLVTGNDSRTTNETLGAAIDFDKFDIFLDRAYVKASPFKNGELPDADGDLWLVYGITDQPWRWKIYKDWLLWDDELSPQGFYAKTNLKLTDALGLSANGGVYFIDENAGNSPAGTVPTPTSKDPKMTNIQINLDGDVNETWDVGGRFTWYYLWDLDSSFIRRGVDSNGVSSSTFAAGNIPGGLTGNPNGGSFNVVNVGGYTTANLIERWPITLLFDYSRNLDASSSSITYPLVPPTGAPVPVAGTFATDEEGNAWLVGMSIGDTKEILRFRMHYAWLEANAFPAQFVDSDMFDQFTNRKGWVWDFSKQVYTNTDASLTAFFSDPINTNLAYQNSLYGSKRFRLQANMVFKF